MHSPYHISDLSLSSGLHALFLLARRIAAIACNFSFRCIVNTGSLLLQMQLPTLLEMPPCSLALRHSRLPSFVLDVDCF